MAALGKFAVVARLGLQRVPVRSINVARGRLSKKKEEAGQRVQSEYKSPIPVVSADYGSLDPKELNLEKLYSEYEETDQDDVPFANQRLPIVLRPDTTLGFHGRDQHESLTRARGYSSQELERLTDMDRLKVRRSKWLKTMLFAVFCLVVEKERRGGAVCVCVCVCVCLCVCVCGWVCVWCCQPSLMSR
jgi:hypothetical protein